MGPTLSSSYTPPERDFQHYYHYNYYDNHSVLEWTYEPSTLGVYTTPERDFQNYYDIHSVIYQLYGHVSGNDVMKTINIMYAKMISTLGSSIFCSVLNFMLLVFLFMDKEQRNLIYFPLMLQALADIIGPGIANAIYEIKLYPKFIKEVESQLYLGGGIQIDQSFLANEINQVDGKEGCFTNLLRQLLNEYTTGVCVALSAFYRYILVCHPTKQILTPKVLLTITMSALACLLMASATVVVDLILNCPLRSCEPYETLLAYWRVKNVMKKTTSTKTQKMEIKLFQSALLIIKEPDYYSHSFFFL